MGRTTKLLHLALVVPILKAGNVFLFIDDFGVNLILAFQHTAVSACISQEIYRACNAQFT